MLTIIDLMHSSKVGNTRWLAWDLEMGRPRQKTRRCIGRRHLLTGKRWLAQWRWTALKCALHVSCFVTCQWYARCALWTWMHECIGGRLARECGTRKSPAERHVLRSGSPTWPDCIAETLVFQCFTMLYMLRFAMFCLVCRSLQRCTAETATGFSICLVWGSQLCKLPDPDSSDQRAGVAWGHQNTNEIWRK